MIKKITTFFLLVSVVILGCAIIPETIQASSSLNAKQKKVLKMHDYSMWYGSNKSATAALFDLSNKKDKVNRGNVYDKWLASTDYKNFKSAWDALTATEKKAAQMVTVNKEYKAAAQYLKASKDVFAYYDSVKKNAKEIATVGSTIDSLLSTTSGLRKNAVNAYITYRDGAKESYIKGERRYYINKKYLSVVYFLQGADYLKDARASIKNVQYAEDKEEVQALLKKAIAKKNAIGSYSATYVSQLNSEINRIQKQLDSMKDLPGKYDALLTAYEQLINYDSYNLQSTTTIVKDGSLYSKWKSTTAYATYNSAWSKLTNAEKSTAEFKEINKNFEAARTYLAATEAIFTYFDTVKASAKSIITSSTLTNQYVSSSSGLRKAALDSYNSYVNTTGEANVSKSRRNYLYKKYNATVSFLNAAKILQSATTNIANATKASTVESIFTEASEAVTKHNTSYGSYSSTFITQLTNGLSTLESTAIARKSDFVYKIGKVNNGAVSFTSTNYSSYSKAVSGATNSTANKIVAFYDLSKKTYNILEVVGSSPKTDAVVLVSSTTASVYKTTALSSTYTYNAKGTELIYLGTVNESTIKVQIADTVGYMKMSESNIVPAALVKGYSYYMNKSGVLTHYVYNHTTNTYSSYSLGNYVGALVKDTKYYSSNGYKFYDQNGALQVTLSKDKLTQFMSFTTENTEYTAANINAYIKAMKPSSPIATQGKYFIEAGKKYGVNSILLMSLALHESNYGTSTIAMTKYNLFGINATDSNPLGNATSYNSYEESIYGAANFLKSGYMSGGWKDEGWYFGNKTEGFNVRYASDPYWGQKVAGHYYRFTKWVAANK